MASCGHVLDNGGSVLAGKVVVDNGLLMLSLEMMSDGSEPFERFGVRVEGALDLRRVLETYAPEVAEVRLVGCEEREGRAVSVEKGKRKSCLGRLVGMNRDGGLLREQVDASD